MGSGVIRISYLPVNSLTTRTLGSDDDLTPFVVLCIYNWYLFKVDKTPPPRVENRMYVSKAP